MHISLVHRPVHPNYCLCLPHSLKGERLVDDADPGGVRRAMAVRPRRPIRAERLALLGVRRHALPMLQVGT